MKNLYFFKQPITMLPVRTPAFDNESDQSIYRLRARQILKCKKTQ